MCDFLTQPPPHVSVAPTVACVLVHTEVEGDQPTDHARAVLGEGRRVASSLGATLHAVAILSASEPSAAPADHRLVTALGAAGADRVILVPAERPQPMLWATVGPALLAACEQVRPSLVLLAATAGGRDIGPRLAARLGGAFFAEPAVEAGPRGEVVLSRTVYGGDLWRRVSLDELDVTAVATLDDRRAAARGDDEAEVTQLDGVARADARIELLGTAEDDGAALERARVIVVAGGGTNADSLALVAELARALGGELGGTRSSCVRGLLGPGREIGVGGRHVAPDLYVVCGASGSMAHLGAVSPDAEIVAIDRDPAAPIFRAARWGLVGTIEELVPRLIASLAAPGGST
jgi:electron transfer flavoprotein alpha subunit